MRLDRIDQNAEGLLVDEDGTVLMTQGERQVDYLKRNGIHALVDADRESSDRLGMTPRFGNMEQQEAAICDSVRGAAMPCIFDEIGESDEE